jgi:hypothetical protein
MNKADEYKIPEAVSEDIVAAFADTETLLLYSHFYDKGKEESEAENRKFKQAFAQIETDIMRIQETIRSLGIKLYAETK